MKPRFYIYIAIYTLINLFCLYYNACFNIIYEKSSRPWLESSFISLVLDLVIVDLILITLLSSFRSLARRFKFLRYIIILKLDALYTLDMYSLF